MDCCICNIFGKLFGRKKKKDDKADMTDLSHY